MVELAFHNHAKTNDMIRLKKIEKKNQSVDKNYNQSIKACKNGEILRNNFLIEENNDTQLFQISPFNLVEPLKDDLWFRGTMVPSINNNVQYFKYISTDTNKFLLMAKRIKNREWSIFLDEGCSIQIGKITCNLFGNSYKVFKSNISPDSKNISPPNNLVLETKYVK